jgi:hybrid cluster-associated redox disulfide protein
VPIIQASDNLDRLLADFPAVVGVFVARRMACPGCAMAPFETVAEAARAYHLPADELVAELRRSVAAAALQPSVR